MKNPLFSAPSFLQDKPSDPESITALIEALLIPRNFAASAVGMLTGYSAISFSTFRSSDSRNSFITLVTKITSVLANISYQCYNLSVMKFTTPTTILL